MITTVPQPSAVDLMAGFLGSPGDDQELGGPWCQEPESAFLFSRSAWSLLAIVLWWRAQHNEMLPMVWLPDYFCNESTALLRKIGVTIHFYPIDAELNPDWQTCYDQAQVKSPNLFIMVHYFGHAGDGEAARAFCNDHDSLLIEDAAHVMRPTKNIGKSGDFTFYSPYKILAVPQGGVLVVAEKSIASEMEDISKKLLDEYSNRLDKAALSRAELVIEVGGESSFPSAWIVKRLLQRILPTPIARRFSKQGNLSFLEDPASSGIDDAPFLSPYGRRMIAATKPSLHDIATGRKKNAQALRKKFQTRLDCRPLFSDQEEGEAPYRFVLKFDQSEQAQKFFEAARRQGYPVESWPDLPPEVTANSEDHIVACDLRKTVVLLPVHQTLNLADFTSIADIAR
jgi:hypothetical protein